VIVHTDILFSRDRDGPPVTKRRHLNGDANLAARLQAQNRGGDIVLSRAMADEPAGQPLLDDASPEDQPVALALARQTSEAPADASSDYFTGVGV
jgi:hypothetical protein